MNSEAEKKLLERLRSLLSFANPYAQSAPLMPSPAKPSDFKPEDAANHQYITERADAKLDREYIAAAISRDPAPIPATANREGYGGNAHFAYWLSGLSVYRRLIAIAENHDIRSGRVFDFGGSTGRVFRNFLYQSSDWEVWTCDFKRTSLEWNLQNFDSDRLFAFQGNYNPMLPIEDAYIDMVIAMSVFTHIDETETNWLLELRRVMKTGGLAFLTFHNEDTWGNMSPSLSEKFFGFRPDLKGMETMPDGRHVSTFRTDDPYRCNVFHSNNFIRRNWGKFFELKQIIPLFGGVQALAVLQKK